jgi:hypothetical protein
MEVRILCCSVLFYSLFHRLLNSFKAQREDIVDEYGRGVNSRQLKTPCNPKKKKKKISISPPLDPSKKSAITPTTTSNGTSLSNTQPNKKTSPERFEVHVCSAIDILSTGATLKKAADATGIKVSTIHRRWQRVKANKSKNFTMNTNLFTDNES